MTATAIEGGIYPHLSFDDYLAHPAWGSSSIRAFRKGTPAMAKWSRENRSESTEASILGTAAHCAIMTPDLFESQIAVKPEGMTFNSKANKAKRDAWKAEGREILTQDAYRVFQDIVAAFNGKSAAREAMANATMREASVFWRCAESGLLRKCRPDWFRCGEWIYDLKVSIDATKPVDRLMSSTYWNGWTHQLAGGREGLNANGQNIKGGRLVVIASQPPHAARVWLLELREADCDLLELENQDTCRLIAECERTDSWPGTPETWQDIILPSSAMWTEINTDAAEEVL